MTKTAPIGFAALAAALMLSNAILPTQAATGYGSPAANPYCDTTTEDVSDNAASITNRLEQQGYTVLDVSSWAGCLRVDVSEDGVTKTLILDPHFLEPAGSQIS